MIFMATVPASVMLAGIERSTLPGPSVITNIWPIATMTKKVPKVMAAERTSPPPLPPVKATVASQTTVAAAHAQIHGFSNRRLTC